ncbi:hypothetical protein [Stenotrophomonas phage RAS14]
MDIDIDLSSKFKSKALFPNAPRASRVENGELEEHLVGLYFQKVPVDPVTGLTAIPFKDTDAHGIFKIDMLPSVLLGNFTAIEDKQQIRELTKIPPDWTLLEDESIVEKLFQISKHAELITRVKPKSISELADCLALIRPEKRHLVNKYIANRKDPELLKELYIKDGKGAYRKSHAIPYAMLIVIELHLIKEGLYEV